MRDHPAETVIRRLSCSGPVADVKPRLTPARSRISLKPRWPKPVSKIRTRSSDGCLIGAQRAKAGQSIIDDPLGEALDVIGFNEYIGWYEQRPGGRRRQRHWHAAYEKPLIVS